MAQITLDKLAHSYLPNPKTDYDFALKEIDYAWDDGGAYALLDRSTDVVREGWLTGESSQTGVISYSADVPLSGLEKGRYRFTVAALQHDSIVASSSSSISSCSLFGRNFLKYSSGLSTRLDISTPFP